MGSSDPVAIGLSEERPMAADASRHGPPGRAAFARFVPIATRWSDNDVYGHLNNVVYYSLFDTAVNAILIEAGLLDPTASPIIGIVVETNCRYYSSLTYPDLAEVGVAVEHIGRTSVRYSLAVFKAKEPLAAAAGRFTHVYVDRQTNRPFPIAEGHRELMEKLRVAAPHT
jgi:acyl-CoA thioester hydrolase